MASSSTDDYSTVETTTEIQSGTKQFVHRPSTEMPKMIQHIEISPLIRADNTSNLNYHSYPIYYNRAGLPSTKQVRYPNNEMGTETITYENIVGSENNQNVRSEINKGTETGIDGEQSGEVYTVHDTNTVHRNSYVDGYSRYPATQYIPFQNTMNPEQPKYVKIIGDYPQSSNMIQTTASGQYQYSSLSSYLPGSQESINTQVIYPPIEIINDGIQVPVTRAPRRVSPVVLDVNLATETEYKIAEYNSSLLYLNKKLKGTEAYSRLPFLRDAHDSCIPFLPKGTPLLNIFKSVSVYNEESSRTHRRSSVNYLSQTRSSCSRDSQKPSPYRSWFLSCCSGPAVVPDEGCFTDYDMETITQLTDGLTA